VLLVSGLLQWRAAARIGTEPQAVHLIAGCPGASVVGALIAVLCVAPSTGG
jgi:hypothetical protein